MFSKTDFDVTRFKPRMKATKSLDEIPFHFSMQCTVCGEHYENLPKCPKCGSTDRVQRKGNITVQVKADGEFNYIKYHREKGAYMVNRFGRKTTDLPALIELCEHLIKWNVVEAEFLAELYAVDEQGRPLTLPNLIHFLKGGDTRLHGQIKLGVFELVSLNGSPSELIYQLKFTQMMSWFEEAKLVHVLPWSEPSNYGSVEKFWTEKVDGEKWEGLVIRLNGDTWKVKPNNDIDVAIIGVNKNNKGFEQGKAKSLKMALMNEDGSFVEIGDCSGIGEAEAEQLFELVKCFKIGEDNITVYVAPVVIAQVEYIQTYPETRNKRFIIADGKIREAGEQTLVRLRNPHVIGYRADKKACIEDIGLNQLS